MATALKDGDQHRPGTCSERGKSPLDPGSILPTPRIVGKSRNPVASWRLGRLGGLPSGSEQQPISREVVAPPPGAFGECSSRPPSLRPQAVGVGGAEERLGPEEQISHLLFLFLHIIMENFKHI